MRAARLPGPQVRGQRPTKLRASAPGSRVGERASGPPQVCRVLWSRQPDAWDAQWEEDERARRQQAQQAAQLWQAADEAAWRRQVEAAHEALLEAHKHRAALRPRLQQDAQRAKQEQLRRIAPVAKARARARGLASLGLDPEILSLSEKFGAMDRLVDSVQTQLEAEYGLVAAQDAAAAAAAAAAGGWPPAQARLAEAREGAPQPQGRREPWQRHRRLQELLQAGEPPAGAGGGASGPAQAGPAPAGAAAAWQAARGQMLPQLRARNPPLQQQLGHVWRPLPSPPLQQLQWLETQQQWHEQLQQPQQVRQPQQQPRHQPQPQQWQQLQPPQQAWQQQPQHPAWQPPQQQP